MPSTNKKCSLFYRAWLVTMLPLVLGGCGLLFVEGPPVGHAELPTFTCTDSKVAPTLDVVWGGLLLLNAALVAADSDEYENSGAIIGVDIAWAALSGVSAASGYKKVGECRAANLALAQRSAAARDDVSSGEGHGSGGRQPLAPDGVEWPTMWSAPAISPQADAGPARRQHRR
jgi:hypothetical protein